jgi:hypothetical protein
MREYRLFIREREREYRSLVRERESIARLFERERERETFPETRPTVAALNSASAVTFEAFPVALALPPPSVPNLSLIERAERA